MSDNLVYEVAQMMQNRNLLKQDMNDATKLVFELFQKKYFDKFGFALEQQQKMAKANPTREVQLMQAMKLFMPQDHHDKMEQMIDMMVIKSTFENMQKELSDIQQNVQSSQNNLEQEIEKSIHHDGIYDIDAACVERKKSGSGSNMLLALAMFLQGNR